MSCVVVGMGDLSLDEQRSTAARRCPKSPRGPRDRTATGSAGSLGGRASRRSPWPTMTPARASRQRARGLAGERTPATVVPGGEVVLTAVLRVDLGRARRPGRTPRLGQPVVAGRPPPSAVVRTSTLKNAPERAPSGRRALVGLESAPMDALGRAGRVERLTIQPRKKTHECYSKGNRRPPK